jgi:chemotaxis signal transduction protein
MSEQASDVSALRRSFDEAFARAHRPRVTGLEDLLLVRIEGHPYALRIRELEGLHRAGKVVPLPSSSVELLGLAGIRGALVPVFSLPALLGYGGREPPAWLVLCQTAEARGGEAMALGFGALDGHVRVGPDQICGAADGATRAHLQQVVRLPAGVCPLVEVRSIVDGCVRAARGAAPAGETEE